MAQREASHERVETEIILAGGRAPLCNVCNVSNTNIIVQCCGVKKLVSCSTENGDEEDNEAYSERQTKVTTFTIYIASLWDFLP